MKAVIDFLGVKTRSWLLCGAITGLVLSLVEVGLSGFLASIVGGLTGRGLGQSLFGLFSLDLEASLIGLIALSLLKFFLNVLKGMSAVSANEFFIARQKSLAIIGILKEEVPLSSVSETSNLFSEVFQKTAIFIHSLGHFVPLLIQTMIILGFLFYLSLKVTLLGIVFIFILGFIVTYLQRKIQKSVSDIPEINSSMYDGTVRVVKNWLLIKVLKIENQEANSFKLLLQRYLDSYLRSNFLSLISENIPTFLGVIVISALIYYQQQDEMMKREVFIGYLYLYLRFVQSLGQLANYFGIASMHGPLVKQCFQNFQKYNESHKQIAQQMISSDSDISFNTGNQTEIKDLRSAPTLVAEELLFSYEKANPVFNKLNLKIKAGSQLGIVGESGTGKSTLLSLFLGVIQPTSGRVRINNLSPIDFLTNFSGAIAYVGAEPLLMRGSLRENLLYGNKQEISDEDLKRTLYDLKVFDRFIKNRGLEFSLSEQGGGLSSGEKQRISLARALLRKPKLLVLDEVTANLDVDTQDVVIDLLKKLKGKVTVIIVSHRHELLVNADEIIKLEKRGVKSDKENF